MTKGRLLTFSATDTLFFRESRPMEAQGVKPLAGRFPPPARTLAGAVRGAIGDTLGIDWPQWRGAKDRGAHARSDALIGEPTDTPPGPLQLTGPFPMRGKKRLFPVPATLLAKKEGAELRYAHLRPGAAVHCDLGRVALPTLDRALPGAQLYEDAWLEADDLARVLGGGAPSRAPLKTAGDLVAVESRLGIALQTRQRSAEAGMLYQTQHVRPLSDAAGVIEVGVGIKHRDGLHLPDLGGTIVRFGGEGRHASLHDSEEDLLPPMPLLPANRAPAGITVVLLTHARFSTGTWLPDGFEPDDDDDVRIWRGQIQGIRLTLHAAAVGKPPREGGWDLARHAPRAAEALIPAGSVFFFTTESPLETAVEALRGKHIGLDTPLGRGEITAGYWFRNQ